MAQINPYKILSGEEIVRVIEIAKRVNTEELGRLFDLINRDMRLDALFDDEESIEACLERLSKALSKRIIIEGVLATREDWQLSLQYKMLGEIPTFSTILYETEMLHEPIPKELVRKYLSPSDVDIIPSDVEILKKILRRGKVESVPSYMFEKGYLKRRRSGGVMVLELTGKGVMSLWLYEKLTA